MKLRGTASFAFLLVACSSPANKSTEGPKPVGPGAPVAAVKLEQLADPGEVLLSREQSVWLLEGRLLAEADASLHSEEATKALGSAATRAAQVPEGKIRKFLREHRSAQTREEAKALIAAFSAPSRKLLEEAAAREQIAPEDVFLDYLTYEGLYDLATMRYGWRRLQSGGYPEGSPERALADSFFAGMDTLPSLAAGISVVKDEPNSLELSVFGARVRDEVTSSSVVSTATVGRVGVVRWSSSYEALRIAGRGGNTADLEETLDQENGQYLLSYASEVDEYLTWGANEPWATMISLLPVDEAADLYAGVVARGGLEATTAVASVDTLPTSALVSGDAKRGLTATVSEVRTATKIAGNAARRGRFLIVTIDLKSTLGEEQRAPSSWFELVAGTATHSELGVIRPGWGPAILATGPSGAQLLELPYTAVPAKGRVKLSLVYDVPVDVSKAALVVGPGQVALKAEVK